MAIATFFEDRQVASDLESGRAWVLEHGEAGVLCFDDQTGRQVDVNWREEMKPAGPGPGRPRLGVVAREISLLPRHWEWLEQQPSGASAALRRLVDQARNAPGEAERRGREAAGRFMTAMAGNYPGYEEATRALYAGDLVKFVDLIAAWPADVRNFAVQLAGGVE